MTGYGWREEEDATAEAVLTEVLVVVIEGDLLAGKE